MNNSRRQLSTLVPGMASGRSGSPDFATQLNLPGDQCARVRPMLWIQTTLGTAQTSVTLARASTEQGQPALRNKHLLLASELSALRLRSSLALTGLD
jgi:hypothetical protein